MLGAEFLGRDSETGKEIPQPDLADFSQQRLRELTTDARRYGLHATLKAPFFLKKGLTEHDLFLSAARFITGRQSITLPRIKLTRIGSFFALVPSEESAEEWMAVKNINKLAADAVIFFDSFRADPSKQELARRKPQQLNFRQKILLTAWGYPHVFDEYRFHITLTDKLHDHAEICLMEKKLHTYFAPACRENIIVSSICVCKQIVYEPASSNYGNAFMPVMRFRFNP